MPTAFRGHSAQLERMSVEAPPIPAARSKKFTYTTSTEWLGRRNARFSSGDKEHLVISSPPEFKGEPGFWTPEDLFVGAIETCLLMTFASLAEKHKLPVEGYTSEATGTLEWAGGELKFTRVLVKPTIAVAEASLTEKVLQVMALAHRECLVANSVQCEVLVQPDVVLA